MREGLFVVLEGIDGAGTTTQVARLVASLRARGIGALGTREPSDGPIGTQIRQILTGRLVVRSPAGDTRRRAGPPSPCSSPPTASTTSSRRSCPTSATGSSW